jgi:peptidoglycan/LPS O-acetylase OafA/YrhL
MQKATNLRVSSIDAMRGLAALLVVIYHARVTFFVGLQELYQRHGFLTLNPNTWIGYLTFPIKFAYIAVPIFFVLSGYCIHRKGAQQLATFKSSQAKTSIQINWISFLKRRFERIYPVYFSVLIFGYLIDLYISYRQGSDFWIYHFFPNISSQSNSLLSFLASLFTLQGILQPQFGTNGVFWTLVVEMHFYLLYPLLFQLSKKYSPEVVLMTAFFANTLYLTFIHVFDIHLPYEGANHPVFLAYWFTWCCGFYLAEVESGTAKLKNLSSFSLSLPLFFGISSLLFFVFLKTQTLFELSFSLISFSIVGMVIMTSHLNFWKYPIFVKLEEIGIFSYSLYAFHIPCQNLYRSIIDPEWLRFESVIPFFISVLLSILGGYIVFILVEKRTIKHPQKSF